MIKSFLQTLAPVIAMKIDVSTKTLYMIMGILIILLIIILTLFAIQEINKKKMWDGKRKGNKKFKSRFHITIYKRLMINPMTRSYMEKVSYHFRMISPCDIGEIAKKTVMTCIISWSLCVLAFILLFIADTKFINLIIAGTTIVIINLDVIARVSKHYKLKSHEETMLMLEDIIHFYYTEHRVDDAIYQARDSLSKNMRFVANEIYQLLLSEDKESDIKEFNENVPNRFLRSLVNQCVITMEMGEQEVNGKILFIRNLENLQKEIDIEIEKMKELDMVFMGVVACVISPIFFINLAKQFAIYLSPEMLSFYYGNKGFLCDIGLLFLISSIYFIIRKNAEYTSFRQSNHQWLYNIDKIPVIHKMMDNYCDKNATKLEKLKLTLRNSGYNIRPRHYILRSYLLALMVLAVSIGTMFYLHDLSRKQQLKVDKIDMELLTSAADESLYEDMGKQVEIYVDKYTKIKDDTKPTKEEIINQLVKDGTFSNKLINEALANDIIKRISNYENEYFSFRELLLSLLLSVLAYFLPDLLIYYNSSASKDAMEDEVNQYNATIGSLMYLDGMTALQILVELESYAVVFKESIRICINDYGSSDIKALEDLKENEPYIPFTRIIDNFIRCDDMPIYEAFHEIDVDKDGYISRRKLANKKSIKKRAFRAFLLGVIPWCTLIAYCIAPPLLSTLNGLDSLTEELNNSSW